MPSGSSPVKEALEAYVAGRVKAERLVVAVASEFYGDAGCGMRDALRPLIEVIDRASPGVVELGTLPGGAGFEVRLAERSFPKQHEAELRRAAEAVLSGGGMREAGCGMRDAGYVKAAETTHPASRITHLVSWIRRLLSFGSA